VRYGPISDLDNLLINKTISVDLDIWTFEVHPEKNASGHNRRAT